METEAQHKAARLEQSPWADTAASSAAAGAVFSAVFLLILAGNFVRNAVYVPRQEDRLAALKEKMHADPNNSQLLSDIRDLDLRIRQHRVRGWNLTGRTAYFLLGSVVVFLISGKWVLRLKRRVSPPALEHNRSETQLRLAGRTRWAVAGGLVVLGASGVLLAIRPEIPFGGVAQSMPTYASMDEMRVNWPRFRGPGGSGVSPFANAPTKWNGASGQGIVWKSAVPLPGNNSPVVWENQAFVTGADANDRQVYCFDAASGRLQWTGDVPTVPLGQGEKFEVMEDTGWAASTCATDGRRVYAIFITGDLAAFDFNGRRLWHKNLGRPDSAYGYASSLEVFRDRLLVQYDQGAEKDHKSRLFAFDGPSGKVVWERPRPVPNSWASPILVEVGTGCQLITAADPWVIAYDPNTGTEIWRAKCIKGDVAPSPVYAAGLVFAVEPYTHVVAVRADGKGDVTQTHIAWRNENAGPDICSPVGDGQYLYVLVSEGTLTCHRITDGKMLYEHELKQSFWASPSVAGDRLYLLDADGVMYIAQTGPQYKELARCELGEKCRASPAFAPGRIYLRGIQNLYCIAGAP